MIIVRTENGVCPLCGAKEAYADIDCRYIPKDKDNCNAILTAEVWCRKCNFRHGFGIKTLLDEERKEETKEKRIEGMKNLKIYPSKPIDDIPLEDPIFEGEESYTISKSDYEYHKK